MSRKATHRDFNEVLKEIRATRKISQEKLSEIAGVSRSTVIDWEKGTAMPSGYALIRLYDYLKIPTDYLLGLDTHTSIDNNVRVAAHTTGLSDNSVNILSEINQNATAKYKDAFYKILNSILEEIDDKGDQIFPIPDSGFTNKYDAGIANSLIASLWKNHEITIGINRSPEAFTGNEESIKIEYGDGKITYLNKISTISNLVKSEILRKVDRFEEFMEERQ